MCIAILNEANNVIDFNTLQTCWNNNRDGAGMLYIQVGKLKVYKQMDSFNKFYDAYLKARNNDLTKKIVLHFRISTHGKVNKTNCHPFLVNNDLGFVHNGIISGLPYSADYSDTYMFNKEVLKRLPSDFISYNGIKLLLKEFIDYSKLIFLDSNNNYNIINEEKGVWDNGNWYSNTTYKYNDYYDVGGKSVKKTTSLFNYDKPNYLNTFTPKSDAKYIGGTYSKGVTRSYSDNEDWDLDYSKKPIRDIEQFETEEACECCRECADIVKFSETYRIYCCKQCWDEYLHETEGRWNGTHDLNTMGV